MCIKRVGCLLKRVPYFSNGMFLLTLLKCYPVIILENRTWFMKGIPTVQKKIYILLLPLISVLFHGLESTINICDLHFSLNELWVFFPIGGKSVNRQRHKSNQCMCIQVRLAEKRFSSVTGHRHTQTHTLHTEAAE